MKNYIYLFFSLTLLQCYQIVYTAATLISAAPPERAATGRRAYAMMPCRACIYVSEFQSRTPRIAG